MSFKLLYKLKESNMKIELNKYKFHKRKNLKESGKDLRIKSRESLQMLIERLGYIGKNLIELESSLKRESSE